MADAGDDKKKTLSKPTKPVGGDGAVDNKKKFEVKKVCIFTLCHLV